tara:strand:+ start:2570 stop:2758 length:189 start_codon:yes stop_codon:yes gene_type:complete
VKVNGLVLCEEVVVSQSRIFPVTPIDLLEEGEKGRIISSHIGAEKYHCGFKELKGIRAKGFQ